MVQNHRVRKLILPVVILAAAALIVMLVVTNPPKAKRSGGAKQADLVVEVISLQAQQFSVKVGSYGVVKPRTQSMLVAQVAGQISQLSENLRDGGFFDEGEVLLQIDKRDYEVEVTIAQAGLVSAQQALIEEQAQSKQAQYDWKRSGNKSKPSDFVLRKPQLAAQQANVLSAQAQLDKAQLALSRTQVLAPFAGRVLSKNVALGQVVSNNAQLAEIYATDRVEIRLPINNQDLAFLDLPEEFRDGSSSAPHSPVIFYSDLMGEQQWQGELLRTEGAINEAAQQLYVVAQIPDPYSVTLAGQYPIKIGQYLRASIQGKTLEQVLVIPSRAIYQGSYVYIVDAQKRLQKTNIDIAWQGPEEALISKGLADGMRLVISPLGQVSSGTKVNLLGGAPEPRAGGRAKDRAKGEGKEGRNNNNVSEAKLENKP